MKMQVIAVIAAVGLLAAAAGADHVVWSGSIYDVVITDPVPVGANPDGEALVGFMLKIVNTSGNSGYDPAGFNGSASGRTGITTATPLLHSQQFVSTPTLDEEIAGNVTATLIDTHFNFMVTDMLYVGTAPSETNSLAASVEPGDATGPLAAMATTGFGDRMHGNFAVVGGAAADVDGDGDPTTWQLAWIVVPMPVTIDMNFFTTGIKGGEAVVGSFIPEPATLSLLAIGAVGLLRKRR